MGALYQRKQKQSDGTYRTLPTWWIKYYEGGRARRESTGTTNKVVARRILRSREGDVERGVPILPQAGKVTFDEAADDLLNDYRANARKSLAHVKRRLKLGLTPVFRGKRLLGITTADVRAYVTTRQDAGAANATINRELAALKRMFSLAVQAGKLHAKPHIPMLRENNTRRGFFEREQFESVRRHLPEALRPMVTFAYLTGWRIRSEVLGLEWRQVDWQGREVRLDPGTTKNLQGRSFPFTAELEALLKAQWADHRRRRRANQIVPLVFHRDGRRIKHFRRAWLSACKAAGCPGRIPHDFRRTAVRNLNRAGVPQVTAMAMVGHLTPSIYKRYSIVEAGALRDAASKIDQAMGTLSGTTDGSEEPSHEQTA